MSGEREVNVEPTAEEIQLAKRIRDEVKELKVAELTPQQWYIITSTVIFHVARYRKELLEKFGRE
jgi:hypothetical protein